MALYAQRARHTRRPSVNGQMMGIEALDIEPRSHH